MMLPLAPAQLCAAEPSAPATPVAPVETITDPVQIWPLSTEMRYVAHPLHIEGRVSFYDPLWHNSWFEKNGVGTYLKLSSTPPLLRAGQYVRIDGSLIPAKGLEASLVAVTVVTEFAPVEPLSANGRIRDFNALSGRIVTTDAYVDGQQLMDGDHVRLALVIDDRPVIGWLKPDHPQSVPNWQGRFVRLMGMHSARPDTSGTETTIELWISRQSDLTDFGSLTDNVDFSIPQTRINEIYRAPIGQTIRVRGRVQAHDPGTSMVIRDETGQVVVRSVQLQRFPFGTEVEAVGRLAISGSQWILQSALYRRVSLTPSSNQPASGAAGPIETVDQIRQLTTEEAAHGRPVAISGTVTWAMPDSDFFFLQDVSGGIRVRFPRDKFEAPALAQSLAVEGVTYNGGSSSAVDLKHYRELGAMSAPPAKPVTYEQAITGKEDGQWAEMRGFYRQTVSRGDRRLIYVTTPTGEFVADLRSPVNFEATSGSLINVHGVCEAAADESGRITRLMLWVPYLHSISIEEDAPADTFSLPRSPVKNLGQLGTAHDLMRVRVLGVVLHAWPGHLAYVQDGDAGLLILSRESEPLATGDAIEAVGILGREGVRTVLREAVYRKRGVEPLPAPYALVDPSLPSTALDARLVRVRGTLIDALQRPERTRLTLQAGNTLFEANLDHSASTPPLAGLTLGAGLELTGIYTIDFDDSRQTRGFHLRLRSPQDVAVFQPAALWTVKRAFIVAGILAGCTLLSIGWVTALRRRVRRQTEQIRRQLERQARLEADVQHAARLESLGVLAGGIAHDFNNLLTVIMGNLGLVMLDDKVTAAAGDFLHEIERGTLRARDLTQQLLTFAKGGDPLRATVSLPDIVQEAAEFALHGTSARCEFDIHPDLWSANVDKDQISQAVQNLVLNAVDAMPHGGIIRLSLCNEEIAPGTKAPLAAGRYLRLEIADSGEGIKPEILPRIFDPYFSTKKARSGLGLATVYSIVKKHKGRIEAESTIGRGTTFTLWLPAAGSTPPAPQESPESVSAQSASPLKPARVLLMDDEESIRRLGANLLQRIGLESTAVGDGTEAIRAFCEARDTGHPFDLIILDLTIPGGMGGKDTIAQLRSLDPKVPAIVSSGYCSDPVLASFRTYGFQAMVAKPFQLSEFTGTIRQLLKQHQ